MRMKLALILVLLTNICFAQDSMQANIEAEQRAIEEFDFSQYHPKVKEIMMRDFEAKRAEIQVRSQSSSSSSNIQTEAFYNQDEARVKAWYRKIPNKIKSQRRVIEVR